MNLNNNLTQYRTVTITTFNALNNAELHVERIMLALEEARVHGTDVLLLQEVLPEFHEELEELVTAAGWHLTFAQNELDTFSLVAIISQEKPLRSWVQTENIPRKSRPVLIAEFADFYAITAHFAWGSESELDRLETAYQITQTAKQLEAETPHKLIFMGGDFNATPESATLRYLTGLEIYKGTSTHWTNGWDIAEEKFSTARKDGGWAEATGRTKNIVLPQLLPFRIIDYILSYGWNYGKKASPLTFRKFGETVLDDGRAISDHYGITVSFLLDY